MGLRLGLKGLRRGSIGTLTVAVFLFVTLIIPMLKSAIDYNVQRLRYSVCASILEAGLTAAYPAVSQESLSLGQLSLDQETARAMVMGQLRHNMRQAGISAELTSLSLAFTTVNRREDSGHWLSGRRPDAMPVISATAEWAFADGQRCRVSDRIELILD